MPPRKGRPPNPPDDPDALGERLVIRISTRLKEAIEAAAKKDRRKPSEWVRLHLEDSLLEQPKDE